MEQAAEQAVNLTMNYAIAIALAGAALATFMTGIGSSIGLGIAGRAATGVLSEKPERYGLMTILVVLPSTQGIYGFVIGLFILIKLNMFGGGLEDLSIATGLQLFAASLPVAIAGMFSAIHQGKTCAGGILMSRRVLFTRHWSSSTRFSGFLSPSLP